MNFISFNPKRLKSLQRIFAWLTIISIFFQSSSGLFFFSPVFAQEPTPTVEATVTPSVEPTATPTVESTTVEPSVTPSVESTIAPSATPTAEITVAPTVMPTDIPSATPTAEITHTTVQPTTTPTPTPIVFEKECLTDQTIKDSVSEDWNIDFEKSLAETKEKVQLGIRYLYPLENKVTVTFKCLPKDESQRAALKIQSIKVADLKLPSDVTPASDSAYDITTGMEKGTFEYDVTLPKFEDQSAAVSYIEKSVDEIKNQTDSLKTEDIQLVEENKINQETATVKAAGLDHFSIWFSFFPFPPFPSVTPSPAPNPSLQQSCGLDIALVIDSSGSISNSELNQMKAAFKGFVDALNGTPTQFSVTEFDTTATVKQSFTNNFSAVKNAIDSASSGGYTNWEDGLTKARSTLSAGRPDKPNLVIFASDGNPNHIGSGQSASETESVRKAVFVANSLKTDYSARMMVLGIGNDLDIDNLKAISGPSQGTTISNDVIITDFGSLASQLASLAQQTCGGTITVNKFIDQAPAGTGWSFEVDGQSYSTDNNGKTIAIPVNPGTYSVIETGQVAGYNFTSATCQNQNGPIGSPTTNGVTSIPVTSSDIITCNFINTINNGTLVIQKNVLDSDSQEVVDDHQFTVNLDNADPKIISESQNATYSGVLAGLHTVTEETDPDYDFVSCLPDEDPQTLGTQVIVIAGQTTTLTCTNLQKALPPLLSHLVITKTNDKKGQTLDKDAIITYTLTVANDGQGIAKNVEISDVQPVADYFDYLEDSGQLKLEPDGLPQPITATGTNPYYWFIGDILPGQTYALTYQMRIISENLPGTHYNLAFAAGVLSDGATPVVSDVVEDPFDLVVNPNPSSLYSGEILVEGVVLGAATILGAATGSATLWLILSFLMILGGLILIISAHKKWRNLMKKFAFSFILIALLVPVFVNFALAIDDTQAPSIHIVNLPEYKRVRDFEISYTALDNLSGLRDVHVEYKKDDGSWQDLGTYANTSLKIRVDSSKIDSDAKYYFQATACDHNNNCATSSTNTIVDTANPPQPDNYAKDHPSSTSYRLKWHNPDSDDLYQLYIYRSDIRDFDANNEHRVSFIGVTKNTDQEWTDSSLPDSNKEYFYAIRNVDKAGNGSDLVGDTYTTTIEVTPTPGGTVGETVAGAAGVAGQVAQPGSQILGEQGAATSGAEEIVLPGEEEGQGGITEAVKKSPWLWFLGGAVALGLVYRWFTSRPEAPVVKKTKKTFKKSKED